MKRFINTNSERIYSKRKYDNFKHTKSFPDMKPKGIWYEVEDSWRQWCDSEGSRCDYDDDFNEIPSTREPFQTYKHLHEIELNEDEVYMLSSEDDVRTLLEDFELEVEGFTKNGYPLSKLYNDYVDWEKLTKYYKGVEITNYSAVAFGPSNYRLLGGLWINAWDVSSGCLWDLSAIKSRKKIY